MYQVPSPPATGVVVDSHGITWRRNVSDTWDPDPCASCGAGPSGPLTWTQVLELRGPVT